MLYQLRTVFQHAYQYKVNTVHDGIMNQCNNVTQKREKFTELRNDVTAKREKFTNQRNNVTSKHEYMWPHGFA